MDRNNRARTFLAAVLALSGACRPTVSDKLPDAQPPDAVSSYPLTVIFAGTGDGTVTSDPAGIDCTTDCSFDFDPDTMVTLTATVADADTTFTGWSGGGCSGTDECETTMDAAKSVTATFTCESGAATFNYTGVAQPLAALPTCTKSLTVEVRGASGGIAYNGGAAAGTAGYGGRVLATIPVSSGDSFSVTVGGTGGNATFSTPGSGGFNGGAGGGPGDGADGQAGAGGGGASDIRRNGTALADRVVVAGGGGGAASCVYVGYNGGLGGGTTGGSSGTVCDVSGTPSTGGTPSAGGIAGTHPGAYCTATSGSLGVGGGACSPSGGGGGGGGYYGGGGGEFQPGGGGSSFTAAGVTGVTHSQGIINGNGQVTINW